MKRITCLLLALVVLMTVFPTAAFATQTTYPPNESATNSRDILLAKAVEAFPEHEAKIMNDTHPATNAALTYNALTDSIVSQETRQLSNVESVTYTELASGYSFISVAFTAAKNVTSTSIVGVYTTYTLNAWMTCLGSEDLLMVYDIKLRAVETGASHVIDEGYITSLTTATSARVYDTNAHGTTDDPAFVRYVAAFAVETSIGDAYNVSLFNGYLKVFIDDGSPAVEFNDD